MFTKNKYIVFALWKISWFQKQTLAHWYEPVSFIALILTLLIPRNPQRGQEPLGNTSDYLYVQTCGGQNMKESHVNPAFSAQLEPKKVYCIQAGGGRSDVDFFGNPRAFSHSSIIRNGPSQTNALHCLPPALTLSQMFHYQVSSNC